MKQIIRIAGDCSDHAAASELIDRSTLPVRYGGACVSAATRINIAW